MKSILKIDHKKHTVEVSIANEMEDGEDEMHESYMNECMTNDAMFVDTAGLSSSDSKVMCAISYKKNRPMLMEGAGELTEKQKNLSNNIKKSILKRYQKAGILSDEGKKQLESISAKDMQEIKAEPTGTFIEKPAPPTGEINQKLMEEGVKIDEKLKKEDSSSNIKNPDLQSANFKRN